METLVLIFTGAVLLFIPPLATAGLLMWIMDRLRSKLVEEQIPVRSHR
jgi:hypothetical protein